jgi:4-methyl-5(b-hydroxyethyl)-thiazole monophosphate biosynthesis
VDGHVVTSRGVGTAIPFALELISLLCGREKADQIGKAIVYYI